MRIKLITIIMVYRMSRLLLPVEATCIYMCKVLMIGTQYTPHNLSYRTPSMLYDNFNKAAVINM